MRSSNPTLNQETFSRFARSGFYDRAEGQMTLEGTVNKTGILLLLTIVSAAFTWGQVLTPGGQALAMGLALGGLIGGFITAIITSFKPDAAKITAPLYALFEGLFLGAVSAVFNMFYPGIVPQAVGLTFAVMAVMLMAYRFGVIRATPKFVVGVMAATLGVALFYLVLNIGRIFNPMFGAFMAEPSLLSIGISLVIVAIAALNLILDFDLIEDGVRSRAPRWMEWYGGFALMTTLVWLYLEVLRLISLLTGRSDD